MLNRGVALLALLVSVVGCGPQIGSGAPRPGPGTPISTILQGADVPDPGYAGYILTANVGMYRVTWAGYHEFRGSTFADPDAIGNVYPGCMDGSCTLTPNEDRVVVSGDDPGRIDFISYPVSGKRTGFDVEVRGGIFYLDLLINGERRPDRVAFISGDTRQLASAPSMPFGLTMAH